MFKSLLVSLLACTVVGASLARADNPFVTTIYTADPSARAMPDGRLYVYASHDMDPPRGCDLMDRYHVFSTADLKSWRDEGQILQARDVPWSRPEGGFMWAPDCIFRNGTYYFYFPHPSDSKWNDSWKIGVATSKSPAKDFVPMAKPIEGIGGFAMIDPCLFLDDDGQAYIYVGGGAHCTGGKLKENMTELDGAMQPMAGLDDFHEGTWVFKRKGTYYLTYPDNHVEGEGKQRRGANRLHYATSNSPLGPWTHKGIYLQPTGCDTSHGSVVEFKGKWYAFYHNQSLSGRGNLRSVCVDELLFNDDGTIKEVVQSKTGPEPLAPLETAPAPTITVAAKDAMPTGPATLTNDASLGAKVVQNLHQPDSAVTFRALSGGEHGGRFTLDITYATPERGKVRLLVNDMDCSYLNLFPTGSFSNYTGHATFTLRLAPGNKNSITLLGGTGPANIKEISLTALPE